MTRTCDICGEEYKIENYDKWASLYTNSVETRVWDTNNKKYSIQRHNTCRICASAIRLYVNRLARVYEGEKNE